MHTVDYKTKFVVTGQVQLDERTYPYICEYSRAWVDEFRIQLLSTKGWMNGSMGRRKCNVLVQVRTVRASSSASCGCSTS